MLQLFFTITFAAEIIVGYWIISYIIKCSKAVNKINEEVLAFQPVLKKSLEDTKVSVNRSMETFGKIVTYISTGKNQCRQLFSKNFLSVAGSLILKIPFKKMVSIMEFLLTLRKLLKV